ncbi:MAG: helix-turn-helix transcriptional regulator [Defluviitaleaceae bacterium]|nr:helix-turn-helix transcriptional regulator [Defluviitaleaceae bacterium]
MQEKLLEKFGRAVREQRLKRKLSQEDLADICSLHRTYISDIELGKRNISLSNIGKITTAFGIGLSEIFLEMEKTDETV